MTAFLSSYQVTVGVGGLLKGRLRSRCIHLHHPASLKQHSIPRPTGRPATSSVRLHHRRTTTTPYQASFYDHPPTHRDKSSGRAHPITSTRATTTITIDLSPTISSLFCFAAIYPIQHPPAALIHHIMRFVVAYLLLESAFLTT